MFYSPTLSLFFKIFSLFTLPQSFPPSLQLLLFSVFLFQLISLFLFLSLHNLVFLYLLLRLSYSFSFFLSPLSLFLSFFLPMSQCLSLSSLLRISLPFPSIFLFLRISFVSSFLLSLSSHFSSTSCNH